MAEASPESPRKDIEGIVSSLIRQRLKAGAGFAEALFQTKLFIYDKLVAMYGIDPELAKRVESALQLPSVSEAAEMTGRAMKIESQGGPKVFEVDFTKRKRKK